jgi:hypothetical protein
MLRDSLSGSIVIIIGSSSTIKAIGTTINKAMQIEQQAISVAS